MHMSEKIQLIVGLGNPGREYENTRHNAGAIFIAHYWPIPVAPAGKKKKSFPDSPHRLTSITSQSGYCFH
jgi:peptidyl-tRNA hydrolase